MNKHSLYPPSSAARRVACPGSREMESRYPEDDSPHAREGDAAHYLASWALKPYACHETLFPGTEAPNGEIITLEMLEGAELYQKEVFDTVGEKKVSLIHVEEKIYIDTIHPECWGTPDAWYYDRNKNVYIWDYKFGHGIVEVFENWQLIEYAAGVLDKLRLQGINDQYLTVNFCIVQPRSYHKDGQIRKWITPAVNLRSYFNILRGAEYESSMPNALCKPSPECGYCTARHACTALQQSALTAIDVSKENTPFELTPSQTGNELRYLKRAAELLDARITGLSEQALSMIQSGSNVPHFRVEESVGRQVWNKTADEVAILGDLMGIDLKKPVEVITPKQAIKAGLSEKIVEGYSEIPHGALKLVADDGSKSRKIFGGT